MSAHKDQYDFSRPSTSGRAGFEPFQDSESGLHLFHFNDENGQPLLFSQAYQTSEKRDGGIESVEKNRIIPGRVMASTSADGFAVIVRAGNHQEIARSRNYPTAELCNSVKNVIIGLDLTQKANKTNQKQAAGPAHAAPEIAAPAPVIPEKTVPEPVAHAAPVAAQPVQIAQAEPSLPARKTDPAARHVFKVSIYQTGENEQFQGKIEHMVSNEKAVFTGADLDVIGGFIQKLVPGIERQQATETVKAAPKMAEQKTAATAAVEVQIEKPIQKIMEKQPQKPSPETAQVFSYSNPGKNIQPQATKRMRVLAVAKLGFTGADTVTDSDLVENPSNATEIAGAKTAKPSISAGQAIISGHFRPSSELAGPSISRKLLVLDAKPKMPEPVQPVSMGPNLAIVSPVQNFKPRPTNLSENNMIERIIEKAGSRQATISNAPAVAELAMSSVGSVIAKKLAAPVAQMPVVANSTTKNHIIGDKPQKPDGSASASKPGTTTHIIGGETAKTAMPQPATPPAIRRVLDPGAFQPRPPGGYAKRSVHYVG